MKKFAALLLGSAMLFSAFAGLAACKKNDVPPDHTEHVDVDPKDGKCDVCGRDMPSQGTPQDHDTHPDTDFDGKCDVGGEALRPSDPVPAISRKTDPRAADGYTVYGPKGDLVDSFRTLPEAIEAAIYNDLDLFEDTQSVIGEKGSYVTLKGSDEKLFRNQRGFSSTRGDVYYYYEDGSLYGVEAVDSVLSSVFNSELVSYRVSQGVSSTQPQNGFKMIDGKGGEIEEINFAGRGWEFYAFSDASVRGTPTRDKGATGSRYTLDLSNVKIAPPYEGVEDKTYAFIGFAVQASQYVFELGIACDTTTGNWYTYCSHSPGGDSVVFNNYDLGELVMTSTWHDEGYFTPDNSSVKFEIMEKRGTDDYGDPMWWDEMTIETGEKELTYHIDEEFIGTVSSSGTFDVKNGFMFVAGLDVVEKDSERGDDLALADLTNGSYFKDLVITQSEIYFATDEEVEGSTYMGQIDPERKGKWLSTYTDFGGFQTNVYDYTIVNSAAFVDYKVEETKSTFSFSYEYEGPVKKTYAGPIEKYMDDIASLKDITPENVNDYQETMKNLAQAYANGKPDDSKLLGIYYNAIDWDAYLAARQIYDETLAALMGPEAKKIVTDLQELPSLGLFKGYKAPDELPEGSAKTDYLYDSVIDLYGAIETSYNNLPEEQKDAFSHSSAYYIYETWHELYTQLKDAIEGEFGTSTHTVSNLMMTAPEELTGAQIVASLFDCAFTVGCTDGEFVHVLYGGGAGAQNARSSFRILFFREMLEDNDVSIDYLEDVLELLCTKINDDAYNGASLISDFENYLYPVMKQVVRILKGDCVYLDEELAEVVNEHMVNFLFKDPSLRWNLNDITSTGNIDGGNFAYYFGETEIEIPGATFRKVVQDTVMRIIHRDSPNTAFGRSGISVVSAVTPLAEDPTKLSPELTAIVNGLNDLPDITDPSKVEDGAKVIAGLDTYADLNTKYTALGTEEKNKVNILVAENITDILAAYKTLDEALKALDTNTKVSVKVLVESNVAAEIVPTDPQEMTKAEIVKEFIRCAFNTGARGILDLTTVDHVAKSFRAYYLYSVIEAQNIEIDLVDDTIEYIKTGANESSKVWKDFETLWAVFGQVARIEKNEIKYLDQAMADVVNNYLVDRTGAYENGLTCYNAYWNYDMHGGNQFYDFPKENQFAWTVYVDDALWTGSWRSFPTLLAELAKIVERDGKVTFSKFSGTEFYGFKVSGTVTGLTEDPTKLTPELETLVNGLNALPDITNLASVMDGKKVIEGLGTYADLNTTYTALGVDDKAKVDALLAENITDILAAYKTLDEAIKALDNEQQIEVKALNESNAPGESTQMTKQAIVKEFIRCALNKCTTGYFCLSHNDEKDGHHVPLTMRAYYLYLLMQEQEIELDFVNEIVSTIKADGNGSTAWEAVSTIWPLLGQVARIMKNDVAYLDATMANAVNAALKDRTSVTFSNGDWGGWWYGQGDLNTASRFVWTYYIDDVFDSWTAIPTLMEKLGTIIDTYGNGVTLKKTGEGYYGFMLEGGTLVGLENDPFENIPEDVQTFAESLGNLPDITDLFKVESGDKVLEGLTSYTELKTTYDGFDTLKQAQVKTLVPNVEELLAAYETLTSQLAELDTTKISVKMLVVSDVAAQIIPAEAQDMSKEEIVKEFIRCALNKGTKGFLDLASVAHAAMSFRAYYLYRLMDEQQIECDFVDTIVTYFGEHLNKDHDEPGWVWKDFETLWAVFGQVARIEKEEIAYLDQAMADVVNTYLADRSNAYENGKTCYNSYWNWDMHGGNQFYDFPKESQFAWTYYIDGALWTGSWRSFPTLLAELAAIVERDAKPVTFERFGDTGNCGFKVTGTVTGLTEDPTKLSSDLAALVEGLNALPDITDLSKVVDGRKVIEGLGTYADLNTKYAALSAEDKAADKEKVDALLNGKNITAILAAYKTLDDQLKTVDATQQLTVKQLTADGAVADAKQMTKQDIVKAFISEALMGCSTHNNRHLCVLHNDLAVFAYTAYYHYTLLKDNGVEVQIVTDIMTMLQNDSWSNNVLKDFSDLWAILGQIARIIDNPETIYLDAEMAKVINEHMVNRPGAYENGLNAYNSEWNWDLNDGNGYGYCDIPSQSRFAWTTFISDSLWNGSWQRIPDLMKKLADIVARDGNGIEVKFEKNHYGFLVTGEVTAVDGPQE